jgi:hypothetical protein
MLLSDPACCSPLPSCSPAVKIATRSSTQTADWCEQCSDAAYPPATNRLPPGLTGYRVKKLLIYIELTDQISIAGREDISTYIVHKRV